MMRVAIVGVCGSGKTTVSNGLKQSGIDAYAVGQEHSIIGDLWRLRDPDAVIYLHASLETVRGRRGSKWPEWIYDAQIARLERAREAADVTVDTGAAGPSETIDAIHRALLALARRRHHGSGEGSSSGTGGLTTP